MREAAKLLCWPWQTLLRAAREEEALLPGNRITWTEVAFRLVHAWPRAALLRELGDAQEHVAEALHLLIDDETVAFFRDDEDFITAYEYPQMSAGGG
ncbi:MAG TPA: hypothetical protein VG323_06775 [Thermoanaerobaculia bacterium]|nr:hypothetical protein [Thermoanaerobaculia bacterium]